MPTATPLPTPTPPPSPAQGAWDVVGNSGTTPGANFLGTTNNVALELKVNNTRALRINPTFLTANLIGGHPTNAVTTGVVGATISGGGSGAPNASPAQNIVTDSFGTVGGGADNRAGDGSDFVSNARYATVGGGLGNNASGDRSTVGGGQANSAPGSHSTVSGGNANAASGVASFVGGGVANVASALRSSISGGSGNDVTDSYSSVGGGLDNLAGNATGTQSDASFTTIGGGHNNSARSPYSTVAGGFSNTASGNFSTVVGGYTNAARGNFGVAAGRRAKANHVGSFVWADSKNFNFASTAANQFSARATGGARFVTGVDASGVPTAGVVLAPGSGSWSSLSDRASKTGFAKTDARKILETLTSIPIEEWSYKAQGSKVRHLGPVAQDFFAAFGLGEDPRHISGVDADGVSLASIKALYDLLNDQADLIDALVVRIETLESRR